MEVVVSHKVDVDCNNKEREPHEIRGGKLKQQR